MRLGKPLNGALYAAWFSFAFVVDLFGFAFPYPGSKAEAKYSALNDPHYDLPISKPPISTTLSYLEGKQE